MITLEDQLKCVDRELGFRRRVYARRVADGKMTQVAADREIALMEAVRETVDKAAAGGRLL